MKDLQTYLLESVENLQETDKIASVSWTYGWEKTKTKSGKPVYWANLSAFPNCFIPGMGKVNKAAVRNILSKISDKIVKSLKIDTTEKVDYTDAFGDYFARTVEVKMHGIYDCTSKSAAQKMEKALDYVIVVKFGYNEDSEADEQKLRKELASLFGIDGVDIVVDSKRVNSPKSEKLDTTYVACYCYVTYDELERILKSL